MFILCGMVRYDVKNSDCSVEFSLYHECMFVAYFCVKKAYTVFFSSVYGENLVFGGVY